MSYNPVIASARRAAKQLARDTGTSYQASLDLVARQAGRPDWNAYLSSPAEIPVQDGDDSYANGPEHAHNLRSIVLTAVATLPSLLALPFAVSRGRSVIGPDLHVGSGTLTMMALSIALWLGAAMMAVMFFDAMAVHPDVPDPGRDGKRDRHSSKDLALVSLGLSALAAVVAFLVRGEAGPYFVQACAFAGAGIAAAGLAILVRRPLARRIAALVSMNGTLVAGFLLVGTMQG